MKKIIALFGFLSIIALGFSGCSDDDEEGSGSDLVGTWELVSNYTYEKINGAIVYEDEDYNDGGYRLQFNNDGKCYSYEYYNNNWELDNEGTWSYKNGKLYITSIEDGETYTEYATIKSLTSTEFVAEVLEKYSEDGDSYEYYAKTIYYKISE